MYICMYVHEFFRIRHMLCSYSHFIAVYNENISAMFLFPLCTYILPSPTYYVLIILSDLSGNEQHLCICMYSLCPICVLISSRVQHHWMCAHEFIRILKYEICYLTLSHLCRGDIRNSACFLVNMLYDIVYIYALIINM